MKNRFVSQNVSVFAGTRIPVKAVFELARAGYSGERILREYPDLTEADIDVVARMRDADHTEVAAA